MPVDAILLLHALANMTSVFQLCKQEQFQVLSFKDYTHINSGQVEKKTSRSCTCTKTFYWPMKKDIISTISKVRHLCCKIFTILGYNDVTGNSYMYSCVHKCFTVAGYTDIVQVDVSTRGYKKLKVQQLHKLL